MRFGSKIAGAVMIAHLAIASGCVSASLEDAAPTATAPTDASNSGTAAADPASEQKEPRDNTFVDAGALRNDDFPTFEKTPQGATVQLSDEEKQDLLNQMQALKAAQRRGGGSSAAYAARYKELQDIARTHGVETKKQIEQ